MQASAPGDPASDSSSKSKTGPPSSTLYRHSSSESGTSSEGVKCVPYNSTTRESISGVSITMKTQPRKDGSFDPDHKTTTRIDFGDHYPDGGWGWIVTGAATFVYILCNGFHYAFGTLYLCIYDHSKNKTEVKANEFNTAWLGSMGVSFTLIISIIVATCQRKSPRIFAVAGGLACALGCLFLSFSNIMMHIFLSYGVLSAGTGITLNSANVVLGRYFRRKRHIVEMIMTSGTGLGAAVMSIVFWELYRKLEWRAALQCISGMLALTILAGSLYRPASMYHPRRKVIMHIKSQKKGRREHEDSNKAPSIGLSALRMRSLLALMFISAIVGFGIYVPFVVLVKTGRKQGMTDEMLMLFNVYLGLGFLVGCLVHGYIVIRESKECAISTHHLCQCCCLACGVLTLLLLMAKDFNAYALYAWAFGIFCGGYHYTLKMYTYQLVKLKLMERAWEFVCYSQCIPILLGSPISLYLNSIYDTPKAGFIFAGVSMLVGGLLFYFMPLFEKHKSNQEMIQMAKNSCSKNSAEAAALLDLDLTEAMVTKPLNNVQFIVSPSRLKQNGKDGGRIQMQCFIHHKEKERPRQILLSKITEEKEGLRLDFNEVSHTSLSSKTTDSSSSHKRFERELSQSCAQTSEYPSDSTHSNHTGKSVSGSNSSRSGAAEGRKFKKSMDNVRIELFDPPSQEKESTATVSYDSDLYINLCEAQV